jgi:hypothetical protein
MGNAGSKARKGLRAGSTRSLYAVPLLLGLVALGSLAGSTSLPSKADAPRYVKNYKRQNYKTGKGDKNIQG